MESVCWLRELGSTTEYLFFRGLTLSYQNTGCFSESRERALKLCVQSVLLPSGLLALEDVLELDCLERLTCSGYLKPFVVISLAADPVRAVETLSRTWPCYPARKAGLRALTTSLQTSEA